MLKRTKAKRSALTSLKDSINGINSTIVNEDNFKREIVVGIIALILSYLLKISRIEFIIILITISLVLILELINTAIESVVDLCTMEYNRLAKIAKDVAASAVLTMCIFSLMIGTLIFVPKIITIVTGGI